MQSICITKSKAYYIIADGYSSLKKLLPYTVAGAMALLIGGSYILI